MYSGWPEYGRRGAGGLGIHAGAPMRVARGDFSRMYMMKVAMGAAAEPHRLATRHAGETMHAPVGSLDAELALRRRHRP